MLTTLLNQQRHYLEYFFNHLDIPATEAVIDLCLKVKGLLIFTGIGKSGIVAEKIAMTLVSTGTKAIFLPPVNFLHGDFGILSSEDCMIILSKSGETEELLNLIPFIKKRGALLTALVSNEKSRLARQADRVVLLPVLKELCPFNLAPTTSTEVQLLFGDLLAVALMQRKRMTLSSYGENHPSGMIGKRATIKVEEVMVPQKDLPLCFPHHRLEEALSIFSQKNVGCLLIVSENCHLQGIFTEGDLRRSLQSLGSGVMYNTLDTLMTPSPHTINKGTLAWEALQLMQRNPNKWMSALPVVENHELVGLLRMHDIVHLGLR